MSDDKNTNIKDKKVDQEFLMSISKSILAFTINIILGSYIVYVSKILHVIQLPTRIDKFPYNTQIVPDNIAKNNSNNIVGINYLYTEPPSISNQSTDGVDAVATAATVATAGVAATTDSNVEKSFFMSRQLFYTKIYVNPLNYEQIYDPSYFLSSLYDSDWIFVLMFKLIMQQVYSFIYWGLCIFFGFVYGDAAEPQSGWTLYLWETAMMIFGPVLFLLFSVGWSFCLCFYSFYCIFMQFFTIYDYESAPTGVRKDNPKMENTYKENDQNNSKKNAWWWRGFPFFLFIPFLTVSGFLSICGMGILFSILYAFGFIGLFLIPICILYINWIFSCILNIDAATITNLNNLPPDSHPSKCKWWKNVVTFFIVLYFTSIINILATTSATIGKIIAASVVIVIYIIYNIAIYNKGKYLTSSLLLSKLEPITYIFTYIFINCSAVYGYNVMTGVIVLFIALWGLSNKHKMLFYPAKIKLDNLENVPVPTKDFNLYESNDNPISNCYDKPTVNNPLKNVPELLKQLKGNKWVQKFLNENTEIELIKLTKKNTVNA